MTRIFVYESLSGQSPAAGIAADPELLAAGTAMRDAIVADLARLDGAEVTCAVGDGVAAPAGQVPAIATPQPQEPADAFVRRMARAHDLSWIVAPETAGTLGRLHATVGARRWIGCDAHAIRIASSKWATVTALAARGLTTPLAFGCRRGGRWVVKPDDGAGTLSTRLHPDLDGALSDLEGRHAAGESATFEPFVDGEALSISMIVGADLARPVSFNRQRIEIGHDGSLRDLGVQCAAIDGQLDSRGSALHALAGQVATALPGLRGFVGIDLVWNEERGPVVIEVNPRVTCAYVGLSDKLGRNLAADVLRCHARREAIDGVAS